MVLVPLNNEAMLPFLALIHDMKRIGIGEYDGSTKYVLQSLHLAQIREVVEEMKS